MGDASGDIDWKALNEVTQAAERRELREKLATRTAGGWDYGDRGRARFDDYSGMPYRLMNTAEIGDEVWWYLNDEACWQHLAGRAGWALVRGNVVVGTTIEIMN